MTVPGFILTNSVQGLPFRYILTSVCYLVCKDKRQEMERRRGLAEQESLAPVCLSSDAPLLSPADN